MNPLSLVLDGLFNLCQKRSVGTVGSVLKSDANTLGIGLFLNGANCPACPGGRDHPRAGNDEDEKLPPGWMWFPTVPIPGGS